MLKAIYPGEFDPVTNGHLDLIRRAAGIADELIVGVCANGETRALFSVEERIGLLKEQTREMENVQVKAFSGLVADFADREEASLIIRGLRAISDFEYELQMAQTNRQIYPDIETVFLPIHQDSTYMSSSVLADITANGRDTSLFMPKKAAEKMRKRISDSRID